MVKCQGNTAQMRYRSLASYHPRYIHQFPCKSIRVIAKGSAVPPSRKSAEPFSSYKVIFQHPQGIRAIRHIRIARTPRLLSFCYQTGNPVLKKSVFSRLCSPSHPLFRHCHSLRLNTFCIIYVCPIPSDGSDSLWHSYSTACTASGYHSVIRVITGKTALL